MSKLLSEPLFNKCSITTQLVPNSTKLKVIAFKLLLTELSQGSRYPPRMSWQMRLSFAVAYV